MIIPSIIKSENTYYKIFQAVEIAFAKLNSNNKKLKAVHSFADKRYEKNFL